MKRKWNGFKSAMAAEINRYLAHKRALGRRFINEEMGLRLLENFVLENGASGIDQITPMMIDAFLASRVRSPRSFNHLLGVVRGLFNWLVTQEILIRSPVLTKPRRKPSPYVPFILSDDEIRRLLEVSASLRSNSHAQNRGVVYKTIFALLSCLGLRVGEVSRLLWSDVKFEEGTLLIRETKFFKTRLVPFGPQIGDLLSQYRQACGRNSNASQPTAPVFSFTKNRTVNPSTISQTFHSLIPMLGLRKVPGASLPTVHCLRHSFAVRTLLRWYQSDVDPASRLLSLSTFLGHSNLSSTSVYLTITDELLWEANQRFERFANRLQTMEAPYEQ